MRICIDVNVVLDVLLNRTPWVGEARQLWDAVAQDQLEGYLAPTTITTIYFLARKLPAGRADAMRAVQACLSTFEICSLDRVTLELAAALPRGDFEDNLQIACAQLASLDGIVTRDKAHFAGASGSVYSPTELLAQIP